MDLKHLLQNVLSCIRQHGGNGGTDPGLNSLVSKAINTPGSLNGGDVTALLQQVLDYWYPSEIDNTLDRFKDDLIACIAAKVGLPTTTLPDLTTDTTIQQIVDAAQSAPTNDLMALSITRETPLSPPPASPAATRVSQTTRITHTTHVTHTQDATSVTHTTEIAYEHPVIPDAESDPSATKE